MTDDTAHSPMWHDAVKAFRDTAASLTTPALSTFRDLVAMQEDVLLSLAQELPFVGFSPLHQLPDTMPESFGVEMGVGPATRRAPAIPASPSAPPRGAMPNPRRSEQSEARGTPLSRQRPEKSTSDTRPLFSLRRSPGTPQPSSLPGAGDRRPAARGVDVPQPADHPPAVMFAPASSDERRPQIDGPHGMEETGAGAALLETLAADALAQPSGVQNTEPNAGRAETRPHPASGQTFPARDTMAPAKTWPRAGDAPSPSPVGLASGSQEMHEALHHIASLADQVLDSNRSHDSLPAPLAAEPSRRLAPGRVGREMTPNAAGAAAPATPLAMPSVRNTNVVTLIDGLAEQLLDTSGWQAAPRAQLGQGPTPVSTSQYAAGMAAQPDGLLPSTERGSAHDEVPPSPGNTFDPEWERTRVVALVAEALQEQARRHGVDLT